MHIEEYNSWDILKGSKQLRQPMTDEVQKENNVLQFLSEMADGQTHNIADVI